MYNILTVEGDLLVRQQLDNIPKDLGVLLPARLLQLDGLQHLTTGLLWVAAPLFVLLQPMMRSLPGTTDLIVLTPG